MNSKIFFRIKWQVILFAATLFFVSLEDAQAGGKIGIYGIRMVPDGADAERYSRPGWGGGLHVVVPARKVANLLAGVGGVEYINLLDKTIVFRDRVTQLRTEQQTDQYYLRLFFGAQVGGHGNGFIRPHAGFNLAMIVYGISTDVVIPDDKNENEIRQSLRDENHLAFGYDITLGVDLNFSNTFALDGGVRYLKTFSLPQQLGEDSETVHPQYFQVYIGIGYSFRAIGKELSDD
jgi:hypothetical protein